MVYLSVPNLNVGEIWGKSKQNRESEGNHQMMYSNHKVKNDTDETRIQCAKRKNLSYHTILLPLVFLHDSSKPFNIATVLHLHCQKTNHNHSLIFRQL